MQIKIIGIGNRIMTDDAIGIKVVEALEVELKNSGFEVIIGETDIEYTLNRIENGDYIIIIDSSLFGIETGAVSVFSLKDLREFNEKGYSLHQMSLIKMLSNFTFLHVEGKVITIEASNIDFGTELSDKLIVKFDEIKEKVLQEISLVKAEN
jgi:hydrogenase maturation protease